MKAIAINPTVINVIPNPCNDFGTSEYAIFSRIAASPTIASNQPIPELMAYTIESLIHVIARESLIGSISMRCCMKSEAPIMAQLTAISGRNIPSAA